MHGRGPRKVEPGELRCARYPCNLALQLGKGLFQRFREMIGLEDQTERLSPIRQEDELREKLIQMRTGETDHMMAFTYSRDLRRDP